MSSMMRFAPCNRRRIELRFRAILDEHYTTPND